MHFFIPTSMYVPQRFIADSKKFLLYSGHGGVRAAEYVKKNLFSNLIRHPKFISDTKSAIGISFSPIYRIIFSNILWFIYFLC